MKTRSSSSLADANCIYTRTRSSTSSSSVGKRIKGQYPAIDEHDLISKLPDDLILMILSKLSTKNTASTSVLSTRWMDLWRHSSHLVLDMRNFVPRTTPRETVKNVSKSSAKSLTKVIEKHHGNLESCTIYYHEEQNKDGTLESWIQLATRVKNTKELTLVTIIPCMRPYSGHTELSMAPNTFSHQSLTSLSLNRFIILRPSTHCFNNCSNLKTLKLVDVIVSARDLTGILEACSSLEVLLLQIYFLIETDVLKIENNNLKYLKVTSHGFERIEVYAVHLDVLDISCVCCETDNFILVAPNVQFNRKYTTIGAFPHMSCNISYLVQEKKSNWYDLMLNGFSKRSGSLSVSIDMEKPKELFILKELLHMWITKMDELEILFKNGGSEEEGECSTNGRELWENARPFPEAGFRVHTVSMYNFRGSNIKEFELALQFVRQKIVTNKMMIETTSFSFIKKSKVEAAIAKLRAIAKGNKKLQIQCF